ncbi:MAG: hypothetical protein NZ954_07215 [Thermofilaceae archaeon]|nr:hypothetical protein [Thermofilaceae archaeon]MDW8003556.1 hypothetical protein [Thermofilaceae archaeon]
MIFLNNLKTFGIFILLLTFGVVPFATFTPATLAQPASHVYYGYVPPSTDLPELDELVMGTKVTLSPPAGYALLDITGYKDGTRVEIYDLVSGLLVNATVLNALEKATFYLPYGMYFKVVSSERVGVLLTGGESAYSQGSFSGVSTFYPSLEGGFRGRNFIFFAAPATHQYGYSMDLVHPNFYIFALEKADWKLEDRVQRFSTDGSLSPRGTSRAILQSRVNEGEPSAAVGYDPVFKLSTTGEVIVGSVALGALVYVPALTGGYVGRTFWAPNHATYRQEGRSAVIIVVPLEAGKVTVFKRDDMSVVAEQEFTESDVLGNNFWFLPLGIGRFDLLIQSTGDITVLVAQTLTEVRPEFIGDGIAFLGSRPNQEVKFYTPSMAVVFSPEDQVAFINGEQKELKKDQFVILGSGVHSVKGSRYLIIQVVAPGAQGFQKWGHYLIEALDIGATYPDVPELFERGVPIMLYAGIGAVVVIVALIAFLVLKRRKAKA